MENTPNPSRNPMPPKSQFVSSSGGAGVCVMNIDWKNGQDTSFISFISSFLSSNSFRLIHAPIGPDLIFNFGGLSVAFLFVTAWDYNFAPNIFRRVQYLKEEFAHFYVILTLQTKEQNDSFVRSYFKYVIEFGRPTFIPVPDREMGFEKIAKIALSLGVSKQQNATSKLKAEKRQLMQRMDLFLGIVTSIPGIDNHDANALNQAIGSIEAIAKASKEDFLDKTDLSPEKADVITTFFREPKFYLGPKLS